VKLVKILLPPPSTATAHDPWSRTAVHSTFFTLFSFSLSFFFFSSLFSTLFFTSYPSLPPTAHRSRCQGTFSTASFHDSRPSVCSPTSTTLVYSRVPSLVLYFPQHVYLRLSSSPFFSTSFHDTHASTCSSPSTFRLEHPRSFSLHDTPHLCLSSSFNSRIFACSPLSTPHVLFPSSNKTVESIHSWPPSQLC